MTMPLEESVTLESTHVPNFRSAYEALLPWLSALPTTPPVPHDCPIPTLVAKVLGAYPRLAANRRLLETAAPTTSDSSVEDLRRYALALGHAHLLCQSTQGLARDEALRHRSLLLGLLVATYAEIRSQLHDTADPVPDLDAT